MKIIKIKDVTQKANNKIEMSNIKWYKIFDGDIAKATQTGVINEEHFQHLYEAKVKFDQGRTSIYKFGKNLTVH